MISCKCIAKAPFQFNAEGIELASTMTSWLFENQPANCLQGDLYTLAYAFGAAVMAKMALEGHLVTEADMAQINTVVLAAITNGTEQWVADYPERPLHAQVD